MIENILGRKCNFADGLVIRAFLFGVYSKVPDFRKLSHCWVAVKELKLSYHNYLEAILFTIYP